MWIFKEDGIPLWMSEKEYRRERRQMEIERKIEKEKAEKREMLFRKWKNQRMINQRLEDAMHEVWEYERFEPIEKIRADIDDIVELKNIVENKIRAIEQEFIRFGGYRWQLMLAD